MLIRTAEGLPSNGAVRRVDRPDGERDFAVAYGAAPDEELHQLLVCFSMIWGVFDTDFFFFCVRFRRKSTISTAKSRCRMMAATQRASIGLNVSAYAITIP